jgi:pyridoxamine 5'-phosphate oxidase
MPTFPSPHVNTPPSATEADLVHRIWTELQRATVDRHHEWRSPVLATTGLDGLPQARTVVLRNAEASSSQLVFFTDSRSPKAAELLAQPAATFVFWSKRLSWQLRVRVRVQVHRTGPLVEAAWDRVSQSPAAGDYLAHAAPGAVMGSSNSPEAQSHHLAVVVAQIDSMDWLELAREGHRRARLNNGLLTWLVP